MAEVTTSTARVRVAESRLVAGSPQARNASRTSDAVPYALGPAAAGPFTTADAETGMSYGRVAVLVAMGWLLATALSTGLFAALCRGGTTEDADRGRTA